VFKSAQALPEPPTPLMVLMVIPFKVRMGW